MEYAGLAGDALEDVGLTGRAVEDIRLTVEDARLTLCTAFAQQTAYALQTAYAPWTASKCTTDSLCFRKGLPWIPPACPEVTAIEKKD